MKIGSREGIYDIILEFPETVCHVVADIISDAKNSFLDMMSSAFDRTVDNYLSNEEQEIDKILIKLSKDIK